MTLPVLDTSFLIRLVKEDPPAVRALRKIDQEPLIVPYQTALEYAAGTRDAAIALADIASTFIVERPEQETLQEAAELIVHLRKTNHRVQSGDAWIAASASLRADYVVTTNKRDFRRLGVAAWHYEKEDQPPKFSPSR